WMIPHFEKMLYDNALLIDIYTKAYARYRNPLYKAIVEETIAWLSRDMRVDAGFYYAAMDADSEGEEGRYYVWTPEAVKAVLGEGRGAAWCEAYGISEEGNFEASTSNPTFYQGGFEFRQSFAEARSQLLQARSKRVAPARDNKCLLAWNALLVRAQSEAGFYLEQAAWLEQAQQLTDWLWETFHSKEGRLAHVYYDEGGAQGQSTLADYAYFIEALLALASKIDWVQPGTSSLYIERARKLMDAVFEHFSDATFAGYFFTSDDHEVLAARKKEWFDNAIPSSNGSLLHSLSALYALTGEASYLGAFNALSAAHANLSKRMPSGVAHALSAATQAASGVLLIKVSSSGDFSALRSALAAVPWRKIFIQSIDDGPAYQLCLSTECLLQTESLDELVSKI
ncbi:MAG TPA: hypothetical protein DIU37_05285, partial [Opitutae bacterium]|nr:hypothetical protein [Opitutae bacterium]